MRWTKQQTEALVRWADTGKFRDWDDSKKEDCLSGFTKQQAYARWYRLPRVVGGRSPTVTTIEPPTNPQVPARSATATSTTREAQTTGTPMFSDTDICEEHHILPHPPASTPTPTATAAAARGHRNHRDRRSRHSRHLRAYRAHPYKTVPRNGPVRAQHDRFGAARARRTAILQAAHHEARQAALTALISALNASILNTIRARIPLLL